MRILLVTPHFSPETFAPAIRSGGLVAGWIANGCEVTVLTGRPQLVPHEHQAPYRRRLVTREHAPGLRVIRTWHYPELMASMFHRGLNYLSFGVSALLLGSWRVEKVDVVVGSSPQIMGGIIGQLIAQRQNVPFVLEVRDLWSDAIGALAGFGRQPVARSIAVVERMLYRQATRVVVVTEGARAHLIGLGVPPERVHVVPHGVDLDHFDPSLFAHKSRPHEERPFLTGYVGRHGLAQGLRTVMECAGLLRPDDDYRFLLVGEGPDKPMLQQLAREQSLHNVGFLSNRPRTEIPAIWASLDACVVPLKNDRSLRYAVPSKVFESMAAATPVVAGASPEANRLVESVGAGLAVEPEDARGMAGALRWLRNNPEAAREMGQRGAAFVRGTRSQAGIAHKFLDVLTEARRAFGEPV